MRFPSKLGFKYAQQQDKIGSLEVSDCEGLYGYLLFFVPLLRVKVFFPREHKQWFGRPTEKPKSKPGTVDAVCFLLTLFPADTVFKVENKEKNKQKAEQMKKRKAEKELSPRKGQGEIATEGNKEADAEEEQMDADDGGAEDPPENEETANFGAFGSPTPALEDPPALPADNEGPLDGFDL